ncbi:hypothetical protein VTN77DRAFT_1012 [Rasamsonia byssochlamydoides]|uniref:uncharacterized protein n=1 Tax=Rasamsonia byssochlamydoides TaxID=89139 RepID=UPI0037432F2E
MDPTESVRVLQDIAFCSLSYARAASQLPISSLKRPKDLLVNSGWRKEPGEPALGKHWILRCLISRHKTFRSRVNNPSSSGQSEGPKRPLSAANGHATLKHG